MQEGVSWRKLPALQKAGRAVWEWGREVGGRGTKDGETDSSTPLRSAQNDDGEVAHTVRRCGTKDEGRGRGTDSSTPLRSAQNDKMGHAVHPDEDGGRGTGARVCAPTGAGASSSPVPFAPYSLQRRTLCAAEVQSRASAVSESSRPGLRRIVKSMAQWEVKTSRRRPR